MPTTKDEVLALVTDHNYATYAELESKLLLPTVRNALRLTANFMTARESYSEKRPEYNTWAWDQIQNGLYDTEEKTKKVLDVLSGEMVTKTFKKPKVDSITGLKIYQANPLKGTGIRLANFEIKKFVYEKKVKMQIAKQQDALMAVATAIAEAKEAEQNAIKAEAQGKEAVMKAKYLEEEEKIKAVVVAERGLAVAKLAKEEAEFTKQKLILEGQGEAEKKKLVMKADGALEKKLATYEKVMATWATAYAQRKVPHNVIGGGSGGTDGQAVSFQESMQLLVAGKLGLDLSVPK